MLHHQIENWLAVQSCFQPGLPCRGSDLVRQPVSTAPDSVCLQVIISGVIWPIAQHEPAWRARGAPAFRSAGRNLNA